MKTKKRISILLAALVFMTVAINCSNDDAITESMNDVSTRLTGFSSDITGAGASLTINGSQMDQVARIFMDDLVIPRKSFTAISESSITFTVPLNAALGESDVMVVYNGPDRAFTTITVVPLQAIATFTPYSAGTGETVTIQGTNLEIVTGVKLGTIDATISSKTANVLKFTVPAGVTTGKISLVSAAGTANSTTDLTACASSPTAADCAPGLNLNTGFESGTGDVFTNWGQWNGGDFMTETTDPTKVFRGGRALQVTRDGSLGSGQWRLQLASDAVDMEVGANYSVFVWAKASLAGGAMRVSTTPSSLYTGDQLVPQAWTRLEFQFTANVASASVVLDMNGNNTVPTVFYIDDVKLIKR